MTFLAVPLTALLALAVSASAQDCTSLIQQSRAHVNRMELQQALTPLEAALHHCANRNLVRVELAKVHYLLADDRRAEDLLATVLAEEPGHEEARYSLGRIYYQQSRYEPARAEFQAILTRNPHSFRAHDNLALCLEALNQQEAAIRHFLEAIALVHKNQPSYDWPYANLASLLMKRGEHRRAFDLAVEAAARNPSSARNLFLTAKALTKLEQWDKSLRWLQQAITLDPDYPEAHYLLAQVYRRLGKLDESNEAFARFKQAHAKAPTRPR